MRRPILPLLILSLLPPAYAQVPPAELAGGTAVSAPALRPSTPYNAAIASDGSAFVAAWNDDRYGEADVFGVRIAADGTLVQQQPFPISTTFGWESPASLIWNGSDYALFARTSTGGTRIVAVGRDGVAVQKRALESLQPLAAAWNGSRYAVAMAGAQRTQHQLRYFDRDFNELESIAVGEAGSEARRATVTAGDGNFLVAWLDTRWDASREIRRLFVQLFDDRATALTPVRELAPGVTAEAPSVSWNGSSFVIVWTEPTRVAGAVVSREGTIGRSFAIAATPAAASQAIGWDGRVHLAVWQDQPAVPSAKPYQAAVVSSSGDVLDRFALGPASWSLDPPAIAANSEQFVVLAAGRIVMVRPADTARTTDRGPFSHAYRRQTLPAITAGSANLVAAWMEADAVYASRVTPAGTRVGEAVYIGPGGGPYPIATASAGDVHLIAWRHTTANTTRVVLLRDTGEVHEVTGIPVSASSIAVATSNGREFAFFWSRPKEGSQPAVNLMMSAITKEGVAATHVIGIAPHGLSLFAAGWTGNEYALYWRRELSGACYFPICPPQVHEDHLTRITPGGEVTSHVTVAERVPVASLVDAQGLLIATRSEQISTLVIERVRFDGSSEPAVRSATTRTIPYTGTLVRTGSGFALVGNLYDVTLSRWVVVTLHLDTSGRILQSIERDDSSYVYGTTWAFGSLWTTFIAQWRPLPEVHGGVVQRAFYRASAPRVRAVRR